MNKEFCAIEYKKQDISTGALKKFFKNLDKHDVTVGIHRAEGSQVINNKGFTLIKAACIQEFGNEWTVPKTISFKSPITGEWFTLKEGWKIKIPPRVFIRIFTDKKLQKKLSVNFKKVIQNNLYKNPEDVYKNIGDLARLIMKERFLTKGSFKPNSKFTIRYKGSNDPLYLTGRMASAIKSEVH